MGPPLIPELLFGPLLPVAVSLGVVAYLVVRLTNGGSSPSGAPRAALLEALSVLAVGISIALFVGFGIQAFYPAPEFPGGPFGPPPEVAKVEKEDKEAVEAKERFEREMAEYPEEISEYNRVVSPVAFVVAVLILAAVPLLRRLRGIIPMIRDGVALGGVLTLLYGLVLALQVESNVFKFLAALATLLVVLVAVYLRFRPGRQEGA